ncbi:MAG: alpha/beta hydrolase, partial [Chloroflexota bacterium]|nr:alpha/beta hydrolase [Chloroflexota bacterium]
AAGHDVYTPTLTGLGERAHLLGPEIGLDTHIQDVVGVLHYEDLRDVVLVGHSYSGMVISGVAEQAAERLGHLVYLDAFVPGDGQSLGDFLSPETLALFHEQARREGNGYGVPPLPGTFGITAEEDLAWVRPRLGMHPLQTKLDPVRLSNPHASRLPRTYIYCTNPAAPPEAPRAFAPFAARLRADADWRYMEIATGHDAMITEPGQLSRLLLDLAV